MAGSDLSPEERERRASAEAEKKVKVDELALLRQKEQRKVADKTAGLYVWLWVLVGVVVLFALAGGAIMGSLAGRETRIPVARPAETSTAMPAESVPSTATLSATYLAVNVDEHADFTVYWKRELWQNTISGAVAREDFEMDEADYGELSFPYLTGNAFLLTGTGTAQIISDSTLLDSGNLIHFRDWQDGLTFNFPDGAAVSAFSFDYRPSETWQLTINGDQVAIPGGRGGFVGIVIHRNFPRTFRLSCVESVQGGLAVDNIAYARAPAP